jgi:hypothetical protein
MGYHACMLRARERVVRGWAVGAQSDPSGLPVAGSKPGGYVPPSRRAGGGGGDGDSMRRREENSVRVTNLSEDTREDDLRVRAAFIVPCLLCLLASLLVSCSACGAWLLIAC